MIKQFPAEVVGTALSRTKEVTHGPDDLTHPPDASNGTVRSSPEQHWKMIGSEKILPLSRS